VLQFLSPSGRRRAPRLPPGIRIYAIGDVHGCVDLLTRLGSQIDAHLAQNPVSRAVEVCLGDYVDRGPNSREVIDVLVDRSRSREMVLLKGNHETYIFDFLKNPRSLDNWSKYGGFQTLLSYHLCPPLRPKPSEQQELARRFASHLPNSHMQFLSNLKPSFACGDYFFVHAGIRPGVSLDEQSEDDLLWIRDDFLLSEDDFEKFVVHGHTPVREPDIRSNRINIDTGAFATGRLTCLVLENDEMQFIDSRNDRVSTIRNQEQSTAAGFSAGGVAQSTDDADQLDSTLAQSTAMQVEDDAELAIKTTSRSQAIRSAGSGSGAHTMVSPHLELSRVAPIKIPTRRYRRVVKRALVVFAIVIVAVLIEQHLPAIWLHARSAIDNTAISPRADKPAQPSVTEKATKSAEPKPVPEPNLILEPSARRVAGEDMPLGVRVVSAPSGSAVEIGGLLGGATLSAGRSIGTTDWRILVGQLSGAVIHVPRNFVGAMDLTIVLRLPDDNVAKQGSLYLVWSPSTEQIDLLVKRGQQLFSEGDLEGGRLLLSQAAKAKDPRAALALGATYDPIMLETSKLRGVAPDLAMARNWYQIAKDLGSPEAQPRLDMLETANEK
jgi:serine/threonine protein phosphatase 1